MPAEHSPADQPGLDPEFPEVSGKWVVIALFTFGILATGLAWTYWKVTRASFFELQKSLAKEYPKSSPRVDGGLPKGGPMTLSVVLHIDYPPDRHDASVTATLLRVLELTVQHQDLAPYKLFDVYLIHKPPENNIVRLKVTFQAADVAAMKPGTLPPALYNAADAASSPGGKAVAPAAAPAEAAAPAK